MEVLPKAWTSRELETWCLEIAAMIEECNVCKTREKELAEMGTAATAAASHWTELVDKQNAELQVRGDLIDELQAKLAAVTPIVGRALALCQRAKAATGPQERDVLFQELVSLF